MLKREPSCVLEKELFQNVLDKTPDYIKNANLLLFIFRKNPWKSPL